MKQLSIFLLSSVLSIAYLNIHAQNSDFLMDERDGNIYLVARFNNLWWMCQNLKYDAGNGSACYNDDETNCMLNGRLYDWVTAQKVCPDGYRLSTDADWFNLETYLGMEEEDLEKRYNRESGEVGKFLKPGSGLSFDAEYVGMINPKGNSSYSGLRAFFWTADDMDEKHAWTRLVDKNRDGVERQPMTKEHKFSVRCVRDATPEEMLIEDDPAETEKQGEPEEIQVQDDAGEKPTEVQQRGDRPKGNRPKGERPEGKSREGKRPEGKKPKTGKPGGKKPGGG